MSHFALHLILPKEVVEKNRLTAEELRKDIDQPASNLTLDDIINTQQGNHIIENILDDMLEPYNEQLEVPEYIAHTKRELIDDRRRQYVEGMESDNAKEFRKDPEAYAKKVSNPGHVKYLMDLPLKVHLTDEEIWSEIEVIYSESLDENGNYISQYNPKSKWDWWQVGGRFQGIIKSKDGRELTVAKPTEIDVDETNAYAYLHEGDWHEKGRMYMFGVSDATDEDRENFDDKYKEMIQSLDPDDLVVVIDCHI